MSESLHEREMKMLEQEFLDSHQQYAAAPETPDRDAVLMPNSMHSVIKVKGNTHTNKSQHMHITYFIMKVCACTI